MRTVDDFFCPSYFTTYFNKHLKGKKGGGRDGLSPITFWSKYSDELPIFVQRCKEGTYRFSPYKEKLVLKGRGKSPRVLSVPSIRDRLVLGVLNDYLQEMFPEAVNHQVPNSYISDASSFLAEHFYKPVYCFKTDFHHFYDELNRKRLMSILEKRLDKNMLLLVEQAIATPTVASKEQIPTQLKETENKGVPQGLAISNILAGIYMQDFDEYFSSDYSPVLFYRRYVDDILILDPYLSPHFKDEFESEMDIFQLDLNLSYDKTSLVEVGKSDIDYIGYIIRDYHKISVRKKNMQSYLNRIIRLITLYKTQKENRSLRPPFISEDDKFETFYKDSINELIAGFKCNNHLYGWLPYFQSLTDIALLYTLDSVIHRKFLNDDRISDEFRKEIFHVPDVYWDLKHHSGSSYLEDYDNITSVDSMRRLLVKWGRINENLHYQDDDIRTMYYIYLETKKKFAQRTVGQTY